MASQGGMNNLTTLVKRLEAATSRLEDIASSSAATFDGHQPPHGSSTAAVHRAASSATTNGDLPPQHLAAARSREPEDLPESVSEFDSIVDHELNAFGDLGRKLGGIISEQTSLFAKAFMNQRQVLLIASKANEPDERTYITILTPLRESMQRVDKFRDDNRKCPQEDHMAMLADGVSAMGWVTWTPKPEDYVADVLGGAKMYGNRVLTKYKGQDQIQISYVTSFVKLLTALRTYVKSQHPHGLAWQTTGIPAGQALQETQRQRETSLSGGPPNGTPVASPPSQPPSISSSGPPPPPPPPLPPQFDLQPTQQPATSSGPDMGAVFADLNRGESVTSGLRRVDKSEMTHKNPSLRTSQPPPTRSDSNSSSGRGKSPQPNKKPATLRTRKPPVKQLEGNKWTVENFAGESAPVEVRGVQKQQSILVSRCKQCAVRVEGKANSIIVDGCDRLDLIVDSLVSGVEVVNCERFRMQVLGACPAVQLDKVDGAVLFLSREGLGCELLTSKCSSVNVTLPPGDEEMDSVECPVPEQIKSYVRDGQLVSEIVKQEGM